MKKIYLIFIALLSLYHCSDPGRTTAPDADAYNDETPEDPDAPFVRDVWADWIKNNHLRIESLDSDTFTDLHFLDSLISDKSMILMGETAHGIAEQNKMRVRVIKYLHQVHGFDIVAFESGLYDCYDTNREIQSLSARNVLKNALYSFWHTTGLLDLMEYMKASYTTDSPMQLAGFDFHPTGNKSVRRPLFLKNIAMPVDSGFAELIYATDQTIVQRRTRLSYVDSYVEQNADTLRQIYEMLIDRIEEHTDLLKEHFSEEEILLARQVAVSVSKYILSRKIPPSYVIRDEQMAENIKFIREILYPGRKIIIWAHNCHVQKDLESVVILPNGRYRTNMGKWLCLAYGEDMYAIGSLAYRGHINYGLVQDIHISRDESIEAILYRARKPFFFLDLSRQTENTGNSWMFHAVTQTYIHRESPCDIRYIPRDQYDGILFIDTVSEPEFVY